METKRGGGYGAAVRMRSGVSQLAGDATPAGTQNLTAAQDQKDADSKDGGTTTKVLGDAALVGGVPTALDESAGGGDEAASPTGSYFDTARLSRQQSRDNDQTALDDANRAIQTLAGYTMLEGQIENLVIAKGYADCVAFMGENSISIVVSAAEDGLQMEDVAKIKDIVLSETEYTTDQIKIMEAE